MSISNTETADSLLTEFVALRLIVRGIVAHLLISTDRPMAETLRYFEEAVCNVSPDVVPIDGLDPDLHRRAAELAQRRAKALLDDIGVSAAGPLRHHLATSPGHASN